MKLKSLAVLIIFLSLLLCKSFSQTVDCDKSWNYQDSVCHFKSQIKFWSEHWLNDSNGINGFRALFSVEILEKCPRNKIKFDDIKMYLGKPFSPGLNSQTAHFNTFLISRFPYDVSKPIMSFVTVNFIVDDKTNYIVGIKEGIGDR